MREGLRERKKAETRRALVSAALRLADRYGPDRVTVEAIAEAAGVSPRTFFNYFASKEDAIVGVVPANVSLLMQGLLARDEGEEPLVSLRASVEHAIEPLTRSAEDWEVRQRLFKNHPALASRHAAQFAEVERSLVGEVARRAGLDPDVDTYPAVAVGAALAALRIALTAWQARDRAVPLSDVVDEAFEHLEAGLALRSPALAPTRTPS